MTLQSLTNREKFNYIALSNDEFNIGSPHTWTDIYTKLRGLLISNHKHTGVLPININMSQVGYLGFIIFGSSVEEALKIQERLQAHFVAK
jgi:hypothetical protein